VFHRDGVGLDVLDRNELAVAPGSDPDRLLGVRVVSDAGEHLRTGQDELDRPPDRARQQR
jgi:hypothetical protein